MQERSLPSSPATTSAASALDAAPFVSGSASQAAERRLLAFAKASGGVFYQMSADWSEMQPLDGRGLVASNEAPIRDWLKKNIPESEHAAIRERIAYCIHHQAVFELEHRVYGPEGILLWINSRAVPVLSDNGEIEEWIGIATDITYRKTAEEQLRRTHDTFYHLIQNDPFGVYVVDFDFKLRQVSLGARKVFENVPQPLLGRDFAEVLRSIWAEPFASEVIAFFRHTLDTGEPYVATRTVERRQDVAEVEAYDWRIDRITLPDGRFGVVCYFYDLSERQRWEAALAATEARLRLTADAIPALISYVDADQRYQFVNAAYRDWFGLVPEQVVGRPVREIVGEKVYTERLPQIEQALAGHRVRFEHPMPHLTLGQRHTETSYVPDTSEDGTVRGFVVLVYDLTDRREAERERERLLASEQAARTEAERAGRMKDEFLATLSHELRTPLNAILGWSQMLTRDGQNQENLASGLGIIERNARAQSQIIADLLDMSGIISGKVRLEVQRIDLAAVVREAVNTLQPTADAKGVRLLVDLDTQAGQISGDPSRLQQVFWNLLSNAVKFTPKGGHVRVTLVRTDSTLDVSVADTGVGIAAEFMPHAFDRFRQADATTTRRHGGLGLGLAIVKQLVEMHGGSVQAKSAGEGTGSTFTVSFPISAVRPQTAPERDGRRRPVATEIDQGSTPSGYPQLRGVRVLVVDDEPDTRDLVKRLLEDAQAVVRAAGSASEALEMIKAEPPNVLICDIGMPVEDGYTLIRRVRSLPRDRGGTVPAAALTAYARSQDRVKAMQAGFQSHIVKPVEPIELLTVVATLAGC